MGAELLLYGAIGWRAADRRFGPRANPLLLLAIRYRLLLLARVHLHVHRTINHYIFGHVHELINQPLAVDFGENSALIVVSVMRKLRVRFRS